MDGGGGKQISIAQLLDRPRQLNLFLRILYTCFEGRRSNVNKWCVKIDIDLFHRVFFKLDASVYETQL